MKDGPYGRNGARFLDVKKPIKACGLEVLFHVTPPEASDTAPGAKVPSRQLSRFLDTTLVHVAVVLGPDGQPKSDPSLLEVLKDVEGRPLKGTEVNSAYPELPRFVDPAMQVATAAAKKRLDVIKAHAREAIEDERDLSVIRIKLSLEHQGVPAPKVEQVLVDELGHYHQLLHALDGTTVALDSACGFIINR